MTVMQISHKFISPVGGLVLLRSRIHSPQGPGFLSLVALPFSMCSVHGNDQDGHSLAEKCAGKHCITVP